MELRNALESPDPLAFESNLPVHQDGTCNGLQHYAALGGDQIGAQQVNLAVTDRPSDVYTYVANMVEQQIDVDIAKGDEIAAILKGKISRKVVKQTVRAFMLLLSVYVINLGLSQVMTTVYGGDFRQSGLIVSILTVPYFRCHVCWCTSPDRTAAA
jgi:DNA-directed RNA polymerase